jgi:hypothetical protein
MGEKEAIDDWPTKRTPRGHTGAKQKRTRKREKEVEEREEGGAGERTEAGSTPPPPHTAYCDVR